VPFNPTPPASSATVAGGIDPLRVPLPPAARPSAIPGAAWLGSLAVAVALVLVLRRVSRHSRSAPEPLERIARRIAGRLEHRRARRGSRARAVRSRSAPRPTPPADPTGSRTCPRRRIGAGAARLRAPPASDPGVVRCDIAYARRTGGRAAAGVTRSPATPRARSLAFRRRRAPRGAGDVLCQVEALCPAAYRSRITA
jgi:hypothetical protein